MSILLNISSDSRQPNESTDNFTVNFQPNVPLLGGNYGIALEACSLWYSFYNISGDYNNTTFRYYNGSVFKNITITPGLYAIDDINAFVQAQMKANGDYTSTPGGDVFYITLTPNYNTFKLRITISSSYQVDLTVGNLYQLFGFDPIVVTTTQEGSNNVNITNGIDRILIHIDCVSGSFAGTQSSDVIYSFSPDGAPSSLLQIKPYALIYLPLTKHGYLNQLRVYVTDQQNRRVNLNNETVSLQLSLKKII
ncbi:MAG TPA: hypothetical protein PLS50_04705 [Candidatus Dojkabacteria bacterium]|nr:hypothetical protein [Candidatus Dojkabacteria bacterium]